MSAVMEASEPSAKYLSALQPPLVQHFELLGTAPGGVAKLRELILTLAVQGKLVTQQTSAESAKETLDRSRAQMRERILNGGGKKEKPSAVITEEEVPFSLPSGWQWCRLTDTGEYVNGLAFKPSDFLADGLPVIRIQNLSGRSSDFNRAKGEFPTSVLVKAGDILVSWSATLDAFIWKGEDGVLNQHIFRVEPSPAVDKGFLFWLLKWAIRDLAASDHAHGLVMSHINRGPFLSKPIGLPPLDEQTRIVTRVEELMRLCDALEAQGRLEAAQHAQLVQTLLGALNASATADELADNWQRVATHFDLLLDRPEAVDALEQTILQLAVRGLLVPQDPSEEPARALLHRIRINRERPLAKSSNKQDEILSEIKEAEQPFDLPGGWEWVRMGNLIEGGSGTTPLRARTDYFATGTEMWVKTTDLNNGVVTSCEELITMTAVVENRLKYFPAGTVCVAMYGGAGTIGKSGVLGVASTINQSVFALPPAEGIDIDFLHTYVISVRSKWMSFAAGLRKDPNINGQIIKRMVMPLPPLAEQRRIVARVETLRRLCADLRQRLAALQTTQAHLAEALIDEVA